MDYLKLSLASRIAHFKKTGRCTLASNSDFWSGQTWRIGAGYKTPARFVESPHSYMRFTGYADKICRLQHNGWYVDTDQDETTRGVVFQLPSRNGQAAFVYGCLDPCNWSGDSGPVILEVKENGQPETCDSKEDAARYADQFAEHYAESCRADCEKDHAEQEIEQCKETVENTRDEIRGLVSEMRSMRESGLRVPVSPKICARLWQDIRANRRTIHQAFKRIAKLRYEFSI